MLDFSENIYKKVLKSAIKANSVAHCRDYPFFVFNNQRISFSEIQEYLQEKFKDSSLIYNLYIHFPFCKKRCTFCKYYSEVIDNPRLIDDYLNALESEIGSYLVDFSRVKLRNIFVGGGTPTLLNLKQTDHFFDIINKFFNLDKKVQITLEGTPETINRDLLKKLFQKKVNLVSLGVQSFNNEVLKKVGRTHSVKDVIRAVELIKKSNIKHFGIDLMIGLPGETLNSYRQTIKQAVALDPDFIECFLFTSGGSAKLKDNLKGQDLDRITELFKRNFQEKGYDWSWKGNFAMFFKKGSNHSLLNDHLVGIHGGRAISCLGLGPRASSHFFNLAYRNTYYTAEYLDELKKKKSLSKFYGIRLTDQDLRRKYIISQIGYRREIDKNIYKKLFNSLIEKDFRSEIILLKRKGIVTETEDRFLWHLDNHKMGHEDFFLHTLKYWYQPKYISRLIR